MRRFSVKTVTFTKGFPGGKVVKNLPANAGERDTRELGVGAGWSPDETTGPQQSPSSHHLEGALG